MSFITAEWLATARARAAALELAGARQALAAEVAAYRAGLPPVPERQAGYYHEFFCPRHAVQLVFDPAAPRRHVCPVDGEVLSGEPFDSAWRWSANHTLSWAALKLAYHAAVLDGGPNSARAAADRARAAEILVAYAALYRTLPRAPGVQPRYPGHATWSVLDESVWVVRLAWAAALLGDALPEPARRQVRDSLLRPAAEFIERVRRPDVHNIAHWNNAALATLALALADEPLLDAALEGPAGLTTQLARGFGADGLWWEGSLSYHYYGLAAILWTLRALRASGRAYDDGGVVRRALLAPLGVAFPDLTLPALHDCWYQIGLTGQVGHDIPDAAGFYEVAAGWYGDPEFAWVLQRNYERRPRTAFEALLDGAAAIPSGREPAFASRLAPAAGLAVLRTGGPRERQTYLMLKAGPAVTSHDHPDKLSIQVFARGARFSPDLGTPGYGIGLSDSWYRQTGSHNTLLVDGLSQPRAAATVERFETEGGFAVADAAAAWEDGAYAGVRMRRTILWREAYFVDVCLVECATPRQVDWVHHCRGELVVAPEGAARPEGLGGGCGYEYFAAVRRSPDDRPSALTWRLDAARLDVHLAPAPGELFVGTAPANPAAERLSMVVRRQTGRRALFLAVFAPSDPASEPLVADARWTSEGDGSVSLAVGTAEGVDRWTIGPEPGQATLTEGRPPRGGRRLP